MDYTLAHNFEKWVSNGKAIFTATNHKSQCACNSTADADMWIAVMRRIIRQGGFEDGHDMHLHMNEWEERNRAHDYQREHRDYTDGVCVCVCVCVLFVESVPYFQD